jgi:hypothetical protein
MWLKNQVSYSNVKLCLNVFLQMLFCVWFCNNLTNFRNETICAHFDTIRRVWISYLYNFAASLNSN